MFRSPFWMLALVPALVLLLAGCDSTTDSDTASPSSPTAGADLSPGSSSPPSSPQSVSVKKADHTEFAQFLEAHEGQVLLVDFWATWCGPCVEQFPHTVELAQKYGVSGLTVASMSCDEATDESKVLAFLKQQQAAFPNFLSSLDLSGTFDAYDIRGGIPFYKLYDRSGKLRYEFSGAPAEGDGTESFEMIEVRIKELLAESAGV